MWVKGKHGTLSLALQRLEMFLLSLYVPLTQPQKEYGLASHVSKEDVKDT